MCELGESMLKNREERIKLLKSGYSGKAIEKLYIEHNNLKVVNGPMVIELVELDIPPDAKNFISRKKMAECAQ
jgi:hypothetical protein